MKKEICTDTIKIFHQTAQNETFSTKQKCIRWRSCEVCGEDTWCGSDGCPLDPQ